MSLQFQTTLRNTWLDSLNTAMNAGTGAALVGIYSGTKPATISTALSGNTLLAKLVATDPAAASASGGVLTLSSITQDSSADATGTATFFRVYSSSDGSTLTDTTNNVFQGTVTATGGGGDIELNTTSIVSGGPVSITSWTVTAPGA